MKLTIFVSHFNPSKTEKVELEDVSHYQFTENGVSVFFNDTKDGFVTFRANDGEGDLDWMNATVIATRVALKIDMNK